MYGVIAHFDSNTEEYIKEVWRELSIRDISKYAEEIEDRRPHLTLASYHELDESSFIEKFDKVYSHTRAFDLTFSILGTFLGSGTLFLSPTFSTELLNFHQQHHIRFADFNDNPESLYAPGKWVPHCTIANRLSQEKLTEAYQFCIEHIKTIHAKIAEVTLIKTIFENEKCVSAPTIHTKYLKF